ncbi:MAG: hypothetical protein JF615_03875 [Asticcacaulis sp.]|nr:hypothetical protein [Asticcacaulis sp.]
MDFVLMGLLIAALWFGVRLDKKLKALRSAHEGFAKAVGELDDAAIRAHTSLKELRGHADDSQEILHGRIMAARELLARLQTQVTRAERVQRELERGVTTFETMRPAPRVEAPREVVREAPVSFRPLAEQPSVVRRPFDRDVVRDEPPPARNSGDSDGRPTGYGQRARNAYASRLPAEPAEDESEMLDKVQMSELVVANLNEMIRSLTLPTRQPEKRVMSVEDDLFGSEDTRNKR